METTSPEPAPEESGGWEEVMESEDISQDTTSPPQNKEDQITADTKNLQKEVNTLKTDNKNLQKEVNTLKTDMEKMQADQINTQKDMEKMQADQINTQTAMEKMQADQINTQKDMEKMQDDQINTQKDMKNMQEILNVLQTDLVNPHQKSAKAPNNSDRSEEPPYKAKTSSWSLWGAKATVKVFLVVTGQTFGADQVILEQVKRSPEVEITRNLQDCDFIIVFCPILSRVGSDVEAAMREDSVSSGGKPVILVLMHHTRDPDYSTDVRRWSETFHNVVLDVHVLFHQTQPGLLRCSRNDLAVKLIQEQLKKRGKDQDVQPEQEEEKKPGTSADPGMETTSPEPASEESEGGEEVMESEDISQDASSSPQNKEDQITADTKNLQMEVNTLKTDNKNLQKEVNTLKMDMEKMQADQINMQTAMKNMQEILNVLQTDLKNPHQKSDKGPNNSERSGEPPYKAKTSSSSSSFWPKATVKVFLVVTGQTFGADQVILEQVTRSPEVEITRNLQDCDFIIVFCPITSRVGSDVEAAMREDSVSSGGKPVILVLMHHTRDPDYSTDVRRWSETFHNVVLDVHVLFHETQPGLLRCSRNDRAVILIQEKLKKPVWYKPF